MKQLQARKLAVSCYDHLGGRLGEILFAFFENQGWLERDEAGQGALTEKGWNELSRWGFPVEKLRATKRKPVAACVERHGGRYYPHVGAYLGALLLEHLLALGWLAAAAAGKEYVLTARGREGLATLGVDLGD